MPESKSGALPLGDSPREPVALRNLQGAAKHRSGWRFSARARNPAIPARTIKDSACSAAASAKNAAKTQLPEPDMPIGAAPAVPRESASRQAAISGNREAATACRSLRPYPSEKTAIFAEAPLRVNSGAAKIAAVSTFTGGVSTRNQVGGKLTASSAS